MSSVIETPENIIQSLDLQRFFDELDLSYDLAEGTVFTPAETRVIYLSSDVLLGVYRALKEETGPAWSLILKNCGRLWGRKVASNLEQEMFKKEGKKPSELAAQKYIEMLEAYFPAHGWGRLSAFLDDATTHGLMRFTMRHSLFVHVLEEENCPVDGMIAGILQGFFLHLTDQPLDCVEIGCVRQGYDQCTFVLTHEDRLTDIEDSIESGKNPDDIYATLKV